MHTPTWAASSSTPPVSRIEGKRRGRWHHAAPGCTAHLGAPAPAAAPGAAPRRPARLPGLPGRRGFPGHAGLRDRQPDVPGGQCGHGASRVRAAGAAAVRGAAGRGRAGARRDAALQRGVLASRSGCARALTRCMQRSRTRPPLHSVTRRAAPVTGHPSSPTRVLLLLISRPSAAVVGVPGCSMREAKRQQKIVT